MLVGFEERKVKMPKASMTVKDLLFHILKLQAEGFVPR
jgi:hypothetical protein